MLPHYAITLDKLETNLKLTNGQALTYEYVRLHYPYQGNTYELAAGMYMRKTEVTQEKYYLHSFTLWCDDKRIGVLSTNGTLPKAQPVAKFVFDNHVFYQKPGYVYYLRKLEEQAMVPASIYSYQNEITCDVQLRKPLLPRLSHMERHSTLDKYNAKPKFRPLRHNTFCDKRHNGASYTFGHGARTAKGTGKQICVYNKTNELADKPEEKAHITQSYLDNGFAPEIKVERIEARISARWLAANMSKASIYDLDGQEVLKTMFVRAVGDVFKFVEVKPQRKPKRNAMGNYPQAVTDLFPLGFLKALSPELIKQSELQVRPDATISDSVKRTTHKALITLFVATGDDDAAASILHFEHTNAAPKADSWERLRFRYAGAYKGPPCLEINSRISNIGALLHQALTSRVNQRGWSVT